MDTDDLAPPPKPARLDLEILSVEALELRIADLQAEIDEVRRLIEAKRKSRSAAEAFFRR